MLVSFLHGRVHFHVVWYNCCGTSEASEQQHNQDLKEKYRLRKISIWSLFTRIQCAKNTFGTRIHCATNNSVAWHFPSRVDFDGARLKRWACDVFLLFTSCLTTYFHSRILLKIVNGFVNLEYFKLVSVWHYSPLFCRKFRPLTTLFTRWVFHCFTIDVLWIRLKTDQKAEKAQATFHLNG